MTAFFQQIRQKRDKLRIELSCNIPSLFRLFLGVGDIALLVWWVYQSHNTLSRLDTMEQAIFVLGDAVNYVMTVC